MLRKRLIFALFYSNGNFMQSRNFRLQKVGNIDWLERNYKFQKISFSLDEIVVLNATKEDKNLADFSNIVKRVVDNVFIPVAAGGGIRSLGDADTLFKNGADKVILNSALYETPNLINEIAEKYGSQSVIASIDYSHIDGDPVVLINDGSRIIDINLQEYLQSLLLKPVGEILLNSIDKDGTGFGYDIETTNSLASSIDVPLVLMGGAGNEMHLHQGIQIDNVSAVATGNLFNFIGNALPNARKYLLDQGCNLSRWDN
jgi:cyclase